MPNWTFLGLHFLHTFALAIWVGGGLIIGAIVAPTVFGSTATREQAGTITARVLQRFDTLVVICIPVLLITSLLMILWYGRLSAWYAIEYVCIGLMSGSALFSMILITPRIRTARAVDVAPASSDDFERFHRMAVLCMQFNLACGTVAILFS